MRNLMIGAAAAAMAVASLSMAPAAQAAPAAISVPPLAYKLRTLANGLKLYSMRDPGSATVSVDVYYDVGARDDPRGRSGFAHLFEHMMFRDTRDLSAQQSEGLITDAGGTRNGSTLFDFTVYTNSVPANQLERLLWLEGERLSGLVIDKDGFEAERHIVEEELRQRILAQPYGRILYVLMPRTVYRDHPYGLEIGGSIADLDAATAEDARAFHETFYRPDNASVIVSGGFDQAQLDRWADRYLGSIARPSSHIPRDRTPVPEGAEPLKVTAYAPNVPLPAVVQAWHAPNAADPDFAAMQVLETLLGQGRSSRLQSVLVDQKGVASRAYVSNIPARDGGVFAPTVILARGAKVEDADAALTAEIARLRDQPVPEAELELVKTRMLADALRERETASGRSGALGFGIGSAGDPAWSDRMLARVRTLTPADLQRVARRYLAEDRRVDIHYLDESQRTSGPAETPLPARPNVGRPPWPPAQPAIALRPAAEREAPPTALPAQAARPPVLAERTLPNGLKVVVACSTEAPLVSMALVVDAGTAADPEGKAGTAALAAALSVRGDQTRSGTEVEQALGRLGASLAARADADGAVLSLWTPQANVEAAGALLAAAAEHPALAAEEVERQRAQQLSALAESMSQPRQIGMKLVEPLLYGTSGYGRQPTEASLAAISRDDLQAWRQAYWRPERSTLVITGALTPEQGFAAAERLFGGWSTSGAPGAPVAHPASAYAPQIVVVDLPHSGQAAVMAVEPGIARSDPAYAPLSAGGIVLSKAINEEVRVKRGLSYGGGALLVARRSGGHVLAMSQTRNESAPQVAELILGELDKYQAGSIDGPTLRRRAALLAGASAEQIETTSGLADAIAAAVEGGAKPSEAVSFGPAVLAATPEQVADAIRTRLKPHSASLLIVGDSAKFLDELKKHHPDVRVLTLDELRADPSGVR